MLLLAAWLGRPRPAAGFGASLAVHSVAAAARLSEFLPRGSPPAVQYATTTAAAFALVTGRLIALLAPVGGRR